MAKILLLKEKKEFVKDLNREFTISKQRLFYVDDLTKDFNTDSGTIDKKNFKKKDGSIIKTNLGKELIIFSADFLDSYKRLKRKAQIITKKDIGIIISETGINHNSNVLDCGTGSGALACYLANICKSVTSYDIRDDAIEIATKNKKFLEIKNLTIKKADISKGISEKNLDLIVLDIPNPWIAIKSVKKALKIGGYLVAYLPTVLQIVEFVESIKNDKNFIYLKTIELIERQWKIDGKVARPNSAAIGHTAFLVFVRKVSDKF